MCFESTIILLVINTTKTNIASTISDLLLLGIYKVKKTTVIVLNIILISMENS